MNGVTTEVEQRPRRQDATESDDGAKGSGSGPSASRRYGAPRYPFSLEGLVRVGRLRLARRWMEAGEIYQAIQAYIDILECCAGTHAADAAVEELLDLAQHLQAEGQFYAALGILKRIEGSLR